MLDTVDTDQHWSDTPGERCHTGTVSVECEVLVMILVTIQCASV